jgi:predicted amidohydrolase
MQLVALQINAQADWLSNQSQISILLQQLPVERPCLVLLPENFACMGATSDYQQLAEPIGTGPVQRQLSEWAKAFDIWLVAGSLPTRLPQQNRVHTTSLVFNPQGELAGYYHKLHLFDVDVADARGRYRESDSFIAGDDISVIPSPFGGLGLSICYDLRFPDLYQLLRQQGADVLLVPAAFTKVTGNAHWLALLQARAIENQCYVVAANQCGRHDGNRETWGHSVIIDPWGEILAQQGHQPGLIAASLDPQKIEHIRQSMPVQLHARLTPVWRK